MDKESVKPLEELLDSVRDIDGFPIGKDENILVLSDPPFYTACPNPYIKQFIEEYGKPYNLENDDYVRTPFVGDVSEGKNDPIYNAHSYHTKVPHKAIMKFIKHYTNPGDIVFDGFCGSGLTGIAIQMTERKGIILDLSPAATYISYNYNMPTNDEDFPNEIESILSEVENECSWLYTTYHSIKSIETKTKEYVQVIGNSRINGIINYTIWSDVIICPYCKSEIIFWNAAVLNATKEKVKKQFECQNCNAELSIGITFIQSSHQKRI